MLALSYKNLSTQQKEQILAQMGLIASENTIQSELLQTTLAQKGVSAEKSKAILIELGLMNRQTSELLTQKACTKADLEAILAQKGITGAQAEGIISALGLSGANAGLTASFGLLGKAIWDVTKALLSNPIIWIVAGFAGLVAITDAVTTSTEEYKEQLDDLKSEYNEITSEIQSVNSELQTTIDRMKELEGKDSLTFTEKEEYDNLVKTNNELQRKIDLLELEEKQKNKEKNKTFVDTMVSDTEDPWEHEVNPDGKKRETSGQYSMPQSDEYLTDEIGYINAQFEIREQLLDDLSKAKTKKEKKRIQKRIDEIEKYLEDKNTEWKNVSDGISYIENPTTEDEKAVNEWLDFINDYQDRMAIAMGGDNAKTNAFNRLVDNWYFDDTVQDLQNLGTQGKVTAKMLNDPKYDEFINKLVLLGVIDSADNLEDIALAFNSIAKSVDNANDALSNLPDEPLSITDSIKQIADQLEPQFAKLGEAYRDIFTEDGFTLDKIDNSMLEDLRDTFTDIEEELGVTFDTTQLNNFFDVLTNGSSEAEDVQKAFNDLATSYLNSTDVLESLNEETAESVIKQLEQMGVTNARTIIEKRLSASYLAETKALDGLTEANKEEYIAKLKSMGISSAEEIVAERLNAEKETEELLTNKLNTTKEEFLKLSVDEQQALLDEADASEICRMYLAQLTLAENDFNKNNLDVSAKIESLKNLAVAYGLAKTEAKALEMQEYETKMNNLEYTDKDGNTYKANTGVKYTKADYKHLEDLAREEIEAKFSGLGTVEIDYDGNTASDADDKDKKDKDPKQFDWIERAISKTDRELDKLDSKVANTYSSWIDRNKALSESISATTDAIALQRNAYNAYMNEANKLGLDPTYVNLIQNGALDVSKISDEKLADKISEYQSLYDSAQDCLKTANELENTLNELQYNEKWELFSTEIDASINEFEEYINTWQSKIDKAELQGRFAKSSYYENMRALTENQLGDLTTKANTLQGILSKMTKGTEAYDTLFAEFLSIEGEIRDLENQIIEFNNNIRDLDWEIFDYLEDSISRITDETEYLNNLIKESDLFDDKGNFTEYADASIGLHASAYDTHMQQAQDYYEEVQELQTQLLNGAGKDVLDRYNDVVGKHRESILASQDEKKAILDLVENGLQKQLDYLNEIIDKKKESLNAEKDLYDYQKSIEEKTKNIASLKKQEKAFLNDDSEYGMSQLQKIQLELSNAEKDLEQTEREQFLQDSQKMLDELYD